jgi:cytochrome c
MKKQITILCSAVILLFNSGSAFAPQAGSRQEPVKAAVGIKIPENLEKVFKSSCMPCHSNNGQKMAKAMLNFSKWDQYGRGTQLRKGKAIARMVRKGSMPPGQFIESSPELALTPTDKDNILKWINSNSKKKD